MGAGESRPAAPEENEKPRVMRIERSQIPDAYKSVGVSDDVVRRVNATSPSSNNDIQALTAELQKERETNSKLRSQMQNLSALQNRFANGKSFTPSETLDDVEEKKRVFDETVQRVEKQFFSYQRENACADNEKELMECLKNNKGKVLNCKSLKPSYDECIANFRTTLTKAN